MSRYQGPTVQHHVLYSCTLVADDATVLGARREMHETAAWGKRMPSFRRFGILSLVFRALSH